VPNYNFQPGANPQIAENSPVASYSQELGAPSAAPGTPGKPPSYFGESGSPGSVYGTPPISVPKAVTTAPVNAPTAGVSYYGGGEQISRKVQPANKRMASQ
jgi:hypothetical protein